MSRPQGLCVPEMHARGAKIGGYGGPGSGKTELVSTIVEVAHLLWFDNEGRSQYYDPKKGFGFEALYSEKVEDAIELLLYAEELKAKGENVAFAIDSFSQIWMEQQEVAEGIKTTRHGNPTYEAWGPAKKPLKKLYKILFTTPVDCLITMRSKEQYDRDEKGNPEKAGYDKPVAENGLSYAVDLVVEMFTNQKAPGQVLTPEDFYCVVTKTSGPKDGNPLPIGTKIVNPSFAKLMYLRREGAGRLEFADSSVRNQVLQATITSAQQLSAWAVSEGLDKDKVFAVLKEKYGSWSRKDVPAYIEDVLAMVKETRGE
jgi:hypothetical protein